MDARLVKTITSKTGETKIRNTAPEIGQNHIVECGLGKKYGEVEVRNVDSLAMDQLETTMLHKTQVVRTSTEEESTRSIALSSTSYGLVRTGDPSLSRRPSWTRQADMSWPNRTQS
ncbi:hypothetical protein T265_03771 [Opisthorchis viverrini]|uniref:Uncharacterized protein n=1 Tax=Opisthorchis viverrini TaxID=6198 RepID=A0A074ZRH8_OPIVI|nr:hypothetical protein T265_03771 [Opisthorchis viverrini]KER29666.1 hypothetical protein T265_03771 [Opisthorchis viverrini]